MGLADQLEAVRRDIDHRTKTEKQIDALSDNDRAVFDDWLQQWRAAPDAVAPVEHMGRALQACLEEQGYADSKVAASTFSAWVRSQ